MAHLAVVRERGHAFDQGEHRQEVRCVAAPVHDLKGQVVGALSASGSDRRIHLAVAEGDSVAQVVRAAERLRGCLCR